jgi:predicted Zn-dependent protease
MKRIEPPDSHHFSAAQGWIELGCDGEAEQELAKIGPATRRHPQVLQLRWQLLAKAKHWEECLLIGRTMVQVEPDEPYGWINRANALFYLKRFQEAYDSLLPALDRFHQNAFMRYNLACYRCQQGNLEEALEWFKTALDMGERVQLIEMGLKDPDLEPLWPKLRQLA